MSDLASRDLLLTQRGVHRDLGAFVVAARFDRGDSHAAFALGDGAVHLVPLADRQTWREVVAHDGAVMAIAADVAPGAFVTGGDDGGFRRIGIDGAITDIASAGSKWVEQVASYPAETGGKKKAGQSGLLACAAGRAVRLYDSAGAALKTLEHPSTVTGLAFDAKGKRIVASHYNGATLWFVAAKTDSPRRLEWKGSHTGVAIHPDGDAVVTSMQENALHGWRLPDGQHMRMSGYPSKIKSLSFSQSGKWLATSGADVLVLWPFFAGGPMGKPPIELGGADGGVLCTTVACHPQQENCAGGFADGSVIIADIGSSRVLPVMGPGRGPISTLSWSADGAILAVGTETGFAALIDFSKR